MSNGPNKQNAGIGAKPDDKHANPLCQECHERQHGHPRGEKGFWHEEGINPFKLSERLWDVTGDVVRGEAIVRETFFNRRRGTKMRAMLFATTAAILAFGGLNALAADLSMAPLVTKATSPAYDWSGFYAGLNVGGAWGTSSSTLKTFGGNATDVSLSSEPLSGFVGGGQLGYNWQLSNLVLGLEGEIEGLGLTGQGPCLVTLTCSDKATWEADIAARLGFASGPILLYGKGGLAWAHFDHSVTIPGLTTVSASETPLGVLVGAGVEYQFARNWTAKLEYDLVEFQDKTLDLHVPAIGNGGLNSVDYRKSLDTLRLGVNYKF